MKFSRKHIFFASASTIVEWYDFMLFAYLTPIFALNFFPTADSVVSLLQTLCLKVISGVSVANGHA